MSPLAWNLVSVPSTHAARALSIETWTASLRSRSATRRLRNWPWAGVAGFVFTVLRSGAGW
jgi:hypothetical protein